LARRNETSALKAGTRARTVLRLYHAMSAGEGGGSRYTAAKWWGKRKRSIVWYETSWVGRRVMPKAAQPPKNKPPASKTGRKLCEKEKHEGEEYQGYGNEMQRDTCRLSRCCLHSQCEGARKSAKWIVVMLQRDEPASC